MTLHDRSWARMLFLALTVLLMLAACTPVATQPPSDTGGETTGGTGDSGEPVTLRIGWAGSPDSLHPGTAILVEAYTIFELVYDSMFQLELDGTYTPDLAESYESSEEGKVWTFKIRTDAKFHDGEPLTAQDVAFSYNLYKTNTDFPYLNSYTLNFESIEAPDDTTVVLTLTDAVPNIESLLMFLYVVPEHIWGELESIAEFENADMIGTGPYKLADYSQNEFVHLEATGEHYRYQPNVDEIIFQTFESQDALVQALRTAQVDMITEVPPATVPSLREDENIEVVNGAALSPALTDIIFNLADPETVCVDLEGAVCSGHPALRDRNVRLAMAHATDKAQLIEVVLLGLGEPGLTLIPSGLGPFYNNEIEDYAYDVDLANTILDDAGYEDTDSDGVREMPDGGQPLSFRLNWPSDSIDSPRTAELLADMWGQIGIEVQPQAVDPDALTAACCPAFDYDILIWGWASDPDPGTLLSVMSTDQIPTGYNETGYSNPEYDELFNAQSIELDGDTRLDMVWELQRMAHEDIVYIIPYYEQNIQAFRTDRFTGWIIDQAKLELSDISSLSIIQLVTE